MGKIKKRKIKLLMWSTRHLLKLYFDFLVPAWIQRGVPEQWNGESQLLVRDNLWRTGSNNPHIACLSLFYFKELGGSISPKLSHNQHKVSAGGGWGEQGSSGFRQAQKGGSGWGKIERNVGVFCCSGKTKRSAFESCVNLSLHCPWANTHEQAEIGRASCRERV